MRIGKRHFKIVLWAAAAVSALLFGGIASAEPFHSPVATWDFTVFRGEAGIGISYLLC
jgi:hypothetical protein